MSTQDPSTQATSLADGLTPSHTYVSNRGYVNAEGTVPAMAGQDPEAQEIEEDEDEYYDDIFEEALDEEDFASSNTADLTKAYNRQRKVNELAADPNAPKWTPRRTSRNLPSTRMPPSMIR
jgi:RIO kinase 1